MRLILAAVLFLSSLASAGAKSFEDKDGSWWILISPPARYSQAAYPHEVRVHYLPRARVVDECYYLTSKAGQIGCADKWPEACDIYVAEDLPGPFRDAVHLHELAHCHGWPADHPEN